MCGIVGAVAAKNVTPLLLEGLKRLEYRGYDSAGIAVLNQASEIQRVRSLGKVATLESPINETQLNGTI
ncbi:MAG: glutamine--fructose-6-phosphate aminotransferase, partial [Gammaproteobacteria bacterium]|nr:glutamine--fructose-6-phosphate aminotransferase [Gammaproteobacteria bacterium]